MRPRVWGVGGLPVWGPRLGVCGTGGPWVWRPRSGVWGPRSGIWGPGSPWVWRPRLGLWGTGSHGSAVRARGSGVRGARGSGVHARAFGVCAWWSGYRPAGLGSALRGLGSGIRARGSRVLGAHRSGVLFGGQGSRCPSGPLRVPVPGAWGGPAARSGRGSRCDGVDMRGEWSAGGADARAKQNRRTAVGTR